MLSGLPAMATERHFGRRVDIRRGFKFTGARATAKPVGPRRADADRRQQDVVARIARYVNLQRLASVATTVGRFISQYTGSPIANKTMLHKIASVPAPYSVHAE